MVCSLRARMAAVVAQRMTSTRCSGRGVGRRDPPCAAPVVDGADGRCARHGRGGDPLWSRPGDARGVGACRRAVPELDARARVFEQVDEVGRECDVLRAVRRAGPGAGESSPSVDPDDGHPLSLSAFGGEPVDDARRPAQSRAEWEAAGEIEPLAGVLFVLGLHRFEVLLRQLLDGYLFHRLRRLWCSRTWKAAEGMAKA